MVMMTDSKQQKLIKTFSFRLKRENTQTHKMENVQSIFEQLFPETPIENVYFPDSDGRVAIVHYKSKLGPIMGLRGTIIDLEKGTVVCDSCEVGPQTKVKCLYPVSNLRFNNGEAVCIPFDSPDVKVREGLNGAIVRVFKRGGRVYHATHKCLDISKVCFLGTNLRKVWEEVNAPSDEELFREDEENSDYVYFFFVAVNVSGVYSNCKYPQLKVLKIEGEEKAPWKPREEHRFTYMDWREADQRIIQSRIPGLERVPNFGNGGFLVVEYRSSTYHIYSAGQSHREFCRGDEFDLFSAFVDLCGYASPNLLDRFTTTFPPLVALNKNETEFPSLDANWHLKYRFVRDTSAYITRVNIIHLNFVLSLDPKLRSQAADFVDRFVDMKYKIAKAIVKMSKKAIPEADDHASDKLKQTHATIGRIYAAAQINTNKADYNTLVRGVFNVLEQQHVFTVKSLARFFEISGTLVSVRA